MKYNKKTEHTRFFIIYIIVHMKISKLRMQIFE
jgi:hypothetical protein